MMSILKRQRLMPFALAAACVLGISAFGTSEAQAQYTPADGISAYYTIQPNATNDGIVHTLSWVALDTQFSASVYDDPNTPGVNEGLRDKINRGTPFGNLSGELHVFDDAAGPQNNGPAGIYDFGEGPVEVRYRHGSNGNITPQANNVAGGYVWLGSDYSDGDIGPATSTPKWDNVGHFTIIPNGGWASVQPGVTAVYSSNPNGSGASASEHALYVDDDGFQTPTGDTDDVGLAFVGFADQNAGGTNISLAPTTGYFQMTLPVASGRTAADYWDDGPTAFWPGNAIFYDGTYNDNLSIEVTVTQNAAYTPKLAVSGDMDSDLDVDNVDIGTVSGNFTGSAGVGEYFGQYYRDGDLDDDGDIDNVDIGTVSGNFTGSLAGNLIDTVGIPNLIYDPDTGNVTVDTEGLAITSYQFENFNAGTFNTPHIVPPDDFTAPNPADWVFWDNIQDTANVIGASDNFDNGFTGTHDFGDIFPTGFDLAGLEAYLQTAFWGTLGQGSGDFDLIVQPSSNPIPTPAALPAAFGLLGMLVARRRRRAA
jgi:hypothetical protein